MEINGTEGGFILEDEAAEGSAELVSPEKRKIAFTRCVKAALAIAAGGSGGVGFVIGASIRATIGALAISFGSAAAGGLVIGAAAGGIIGTGVAAGVGTLITLFKVQKKKNVNFVCNCVV